MVGRHVFYNESAFDGFDSNASSADDAAIATDKQPLLPGQTASFVNYTSYSRGLNGIMIDVADLAGDPSAEDFTFRVRSEGQREIWLPAPAARSITIRPGAGVNGSTRITITWADGAIRRTWLEVTVEATAATGLRASDVFLFGNAIGEVGNSTTNAIVSSQDVRAIGRNSTSSAAIDNPFDIDRDGSVSFIDRALASINRTTTRSALPLIAVEVAALGARQAEAPATRPRLFELIALASSVGNPSSSDLFRLIALSAGEGDREA